MNRVRRPVCADTESITREDGDDGNVDDASNERPVAVRRPRAAMDDERIGAAKARTLREASMLSQRKAMQTGRELVDRKE